VKTKYWPFTRVTANTGTTTPGRVLQITRARTNWSVRRPRPLGTGALTRTCCVWSSTCGEMKLSLVLATTFPWSFSTSTGSPGRRSAERSMGTEM
jgi:hypothetical protein